MDFERPYVLLLLPLAWAAIWLAQRRSLTVWPARQRWVCFLLRSALISCLLLALTGPSWLGKTSEVAVIFLSDVSGSIAPAARKQAEEFIRQSGQGYQRESGEMVFSTTAAVQRALGGTEQTSPVLDPGGTHLAEALRFSAALLPSNRARRIVLFSDGGFTSGDSPEIVAGELARQGIQVDVVPSAPESRPDALVAALDLPSGIRENEMIKVSAAIQATTSFPGARVKLYQNQLLVGEVTADLSPGIHKVSFPAIPAIGNMAAYEVEVVAEGDVRAENNRLSQAVLHGGVARILLIETNPSTARPLADSLEAAGMKVDVRPPAGLPSTLPELENFDLVIFSDVAAEMFRQEQLQMVANWVKNFGGGFLMIGGEGSFGAGGYALTPLAALLPVKMEREQREETPVAALLVILDRSGSMTAPVGGRTKMDLANEGAALSLNVLQSKDLFGVWAVDTRVQEVVPLGGIVDKAAAARKIAAITAGGGGIYVFTSLAEALPQIREAQAKLKHIILFADAADAEEKSSSELGATDRLGGGGSALELAGALLASKVTLSVVALGTESDRDTAFLRDLAGRGGGRFYLTADATTLPRLFIQETMRATQSGLREDVFLAQLKEPSEITTGLAWNQAPPLLGLNIASAKPGSEVLLETNTSEPLLVTWRYGLGLSAAFLSDAKARWGVEWLNWDGYGKFWAQLARKLVRSDHRNDLSATVVEEGNRLRVTVDAVTSEGAFRNGLPITMTLAEPHAAPVSTLARQTAPGQYTALLEPPASGRAIIGVSDGAGRPVSLAWSRDEGREYRGNPTAEVALREVSTLTGGKFDPRPEEIFRPPIAPVPTYHDLAPGLLLLAVILWPVDIWCRRREWTVR